jgi:predicted transcriptional regulator
MIWRHQGRETLLGIRLLLLLVRMRSILLLLLLFLVMLLEKFEFVLSRFNVVKDDVVKFGRFG